MEYWSKPVVVIGAGGFGRECYEILKDISLSTRGIYPLGFIDDDLSKAKSLGKLYLGDLSWIESHIDEIYFVCGIGDPQTRSKVVRRAIEKGYIPTSAIHPKVHVASTAKLGKGVVIQAGSHISTDTYLGDYTHVNFNCSIGHDTKMGVFTTISPLCAVSGFTEIGDYSFLGSLVNTFPGVKIGNNCKIGSGTVVTKDVKDNTVLFDKRVKEVRSND